MARIKAIDLAGPALDWAVAIAEGWTQDENERWKNREGQAMLIDFWTPSIEPAQAYPIIDRSGISVIRCDDDYGRDAQGFTTSERIPVWAATNGQHSTTCSTEHQQHDEMFQIGADAVVYGPTALVAAMRCFVCASKSRSRWVLDLTVEIDVPDELLAA